MFPKKTQNETEIIYKHKSEYNNKLYKKLSCKQMCLHASDVIKKTTNDEGFAHFIKLMCYEHTSDTCNKEIWDTFIESQLIKKK